MKSNFGAPLTFHSLPSAPVIKHITTSKHQKRVNTWGKVTIESMLDSKKTPIAPVRIPILEWLPQYNKDHFLKDLVAGLTVFVFLVPQGMAYSILAGLPPIYGLYSATIPLYFYAFFSTSRQLSMGPMAITSLLLGANCQKYGYDDGSAGYVTVAISFSFMVGFLTLLMGLLKMGLLAEIISSSVLVGFLTASALVIALSQLKYILGLSVPRFTYTHQTIIYILSHLHEVNWRALLIGIVTFVSLYLIKEWKRKNKAPSASCPPILFKTMYIISNLSNLLAIFIGSLVALAIVEGGGPLRIVGDVPSGMRAPSLNFVNIDQLITMIPTSLAMSFVAFANNWAIAVKYANINNYEVEATQELVASGLASMIGSFFNCFLVGGGLARTSVNAESGATTQMATIITATMMTIAIFAFTKLFYYIPMAVLAAIIEVSILGMVDFDTMRKAYKVDKRDCFVMVVTFLATFFIGVTNGLFVGIFLSFAVVMKGVAFPYIAHMGRLPEDEGGYYKDILRFPEAEQAPGFAIVRMDASLFFGNCAYFKSVVLEASQGTFHSSSEPIKTVIIDCCAWIDVDLAGIQTLNEIRETLLKGWGINLAIASLKGRVRDIIRKSGYNGMSLVYFSVDDAVHGRSPIRSRVSMIITESFQNESNSKKASKEVPESVNDGSDEEVGYEEKIDKRLKSSNGQSAQLPSINRPCYNPLQQISESPEAKVATTPGSPGVGEDGIYL